MPVVSVIMAYHRVTPFLRLAVRSILDQTLNDLELVLVDDGTGHGLEPLGEDGRDPRIRLVRHSSNLGIAAAHNAALAASRGEFIAMLDHDDIALPHRLERQVEELRRDQNLGLVGCHAATIDSQGAVLGPQFTLAGAVEQRTFSAYSNPACAPGYAGRREIFTRFPYRPEFRFAEDYDFLARSAEVTETRALPEILLHYRQHPGQMTVTHHTSQVLGACMIRLLTARRRAGRAEDLPGLFGKVGAWVTAPPSPALAYAHFGRLCLEENFPLLASYHARRLLSVTRGPEALMQAAGLQLGALGQAPAEAGQLLRMFLTGPLRTHGLRPL